MDIMYIIARYPKWPRRPALLWRDWGVNQEVDPWLYPNGDWVPRVGWPVSFSNWTMSSSRTICLSPSGWYQGGTPCMLMINQWNPLPPHCAFHRAAVKTSCSEGSLCSFVFVCCCCFHFQCVADQCFLSLLCSMRYTPKSMLECHSHVKLP